MPYNKLLNIVGSRSKRLPLLFECLQCKNKFTIEDVAQKKIYIETNVCKECYITASQTNSKVWCFGKLQRSNSPGYSEENVACRSLCSDRRICKKFINKLTRRNN